MLRRFRRQSRRKPCGIAAREPREYRVKIEGEWVDVPDEALVEVPNRFGSAVVWYSWSWTLERKKEFQIRCFLPGTLT